MAIDNTLLGKYDKEALNVKEAVYRVKNSADDGYVRVHFETNSKMVHDATDAATANKIARRNSDGSISFNKTNSSSLEVTGASNLKGKVSVGDTLTVADGKTTTLGGALTTKGESNFNSKTNHNADSTVKGTLSIEARSGGTSGELKVAGPAALSNTLTVSSTTTLNSTLTTSGNTELKSDLKVGKTATIDGATTINNNTTLGKADNTNTTTINGIAAINKITIKDSGLVANLNADKVDGCDVNNGQITDTNLWTAKKTDETKANKSVKIQAGTAISVSGGTLAGDNTISHVNVSRGADVSGSLGTSGTVCNVVSTVASNQQGHVTGATVVNLDNRYYTKDLTNQQIENRINNVIGNDVILKNPSSGTANGTNLKMDGFTMQFNKSANAIEFVFV